MVWLSIVGAVILLWVVLVVLFTPGIRYRLSRRTSIHADDVLYTMQSTCLVGPCVWSLERQQ